MQIVTTSGELAFLTRRWQAAGDRIGLVPTMGALHEGHASLLDEARVAVERVVVSIFVNPIQFNDRHDYETYPDTFEEDADLCRLHGVDAIYRPTADRMYPDRFSTRVHVAGITDRWEGADRPGHFDGVSTVVTKLFAASRADVAFFGRKDFQQAAVVRRLARDLDLPVDVRVCPTVRDHDGLALSSRNRRLNEAGRRSALAIPAALQSLQSAFSDGEVTAAPLIESARERLAQAGLVVHYVAVVDADSLDPVDVARTGNVVLVAATCDGVRLIDNATLV